MIVALLIFNADTLLDLFRGHIEVVALVHETTGVRTGSPVEIGGVTAGRVTHVRVAPAGSDAPIALRLRMDDRVEPVLRQGSRARTGMRRFVAEPVVRITVGPSHAPPIEDGDTLYPDEVVSLDSLLERGKRFPGALDSLRSALGRVRDLAGEAGPRVAALTARLESVQGEAAALTDALGRGSLGRLLEDPALGRRIEGLQQQVAALGTAAEKLGRYGGDGRLAEDAAEVMARADRIGARLDAIQQSLESGAGVVPRLQRDSALARAMAGVTAQIDSLTAEGLGFALRMILP